MKLADELFSKGCEKLDSEEFEAALDLFLKGAEMGCSSAMNNLGYMYSEGLGTKIDYNKSFKFYMEAINNGDDTSVCNIAINYRCLGDIKNAKEWFEKAISVGDINAALELAKLYMVSDKEEENIIKYLDMVIQNGDCIESVIDEAKELRQLFKK